MFLQDSVKNYMINKPLTVSPWDSVLKVIEIIVTGKDQLPVINEKKQLIGMVTWQDISEKVILKNKEPREVKVEEVMRTSITTLTPKDSIKDALKILTREKFVLPVQEDKKLVGLLSFMDVLRSYLKEN